MIIKRRRYHNQPNDRKNLSYFYNENRKDYIDNWITLDDNIIPEDRYTSMKRLARLDENWLDIAKLTFDIQNDYSHLSTHVISDIEAKQFIRDNTDLVEESDWKFLISEAHTDEFTGEEIEAKYLTI